MSRLLPVAALTACAAMFIGRTAAAESRAPGPNDTVLFTFVIFGDNKNGDEIVKTALRNMKRIKPSFFIGMGDHFNSRGNWRQFDAAITEVFGSLDRFHERFYITAGDNEAGALAGRQDALGAERPFFYHVKLFDKTADAPLRKSIVAYDKKWLDYYAQLCVGRTRVHLVNLYDQDSVKMQPETLAFAGRVTARVKKRYLGEPSIVFAHDGTWWAKTFKPGHALYSFDLLLGASWHVYACYGPQGGGANLGFNTSAVGRQGASWYAVMVLRGKFVLLNINDRKFEIKGRPGCHIKPFGKRGYNGDAKTWFAKLVAYGESVPGAWGPAPADPASFGYDKLPDLAQRAARGEGLGSLLSTLGRLATGSDAAKAAEARKLTKEIEDDFARRLAEADGGKAKDPVAAMRIYKALRAAYNGHDLSKTARARETELERDPAYRKERRAARALERIRAAEKRIRGPIDPKDPRFVSRNRATLFQIGRAAKQIVKTYPDSRAAAQAREILDKYGLK